MISFSAYPDPMCGIDYSVDGFAELPEFIVFSGEHFPLMRYITDNTVTRHY